MKFKENRRKIDPAVYNIRRLTEKPLPATRTQHVNKNLSPKSSNLSKTAKQSKRHSKRSEPENSVENIPNITLDTPPSSPQRAETEENEPNTETHSQSGVI